MNKVDRERVLAYVKANELTKAELMNVSGGSMEATMTTHRTMKVTGDSSSPDGNVDITIDW